MADETVRTTGYHPKQGAQTFDLKPGESLPKGWSDKPGPGQHPHEKEPGYVPPEPEDLPALTAKGGSQSQAGGDQGQEGDRPKQGAKQPDQGGDQGSGKSAA